MAPSTLWTASIGVPVQSRHPCQHHGRKLLGQRVTRGIESTGRKGTQCETVVKIECFFGVLCPDRRCCHVESVLGGKAARSALVLAFGYAVSPRARRLERGCGRGRGTRGSGGGAGVRVRSACAWPASDMVACRVSRTIGCERELGLHASRPAGARSK